MEEGDRRRSWSVLGRPCGGRAVVGSQAVLNSLQRMGVEGQKSWKFLIFGNHPPRSPEILHGLSAQSTGNAWPFPLSRPLLPGPPHVTLACLQTARGHLQGPGLAKPPAQPRGSDKYPQKSHLFQTACVTNGNAKVP